MGILPIDFSDLDKGIRDIVVLFNENGVETFESCQGGKGHAFFEPTIRFHGECHEGYRVFALARANRLRISAIRRVWDCEDGELVGPCWEATFY